MRTPALRIGFALTVALALAAPAQAAPREQLVVELRGTPVVRAAPADAMRGADGRLSDRSFAARLTLAEIAGEQRAAELRIRRAVPGARVIGRMRHAMDALVVEAPPGSARALARLAGVRKVWPSLGYRRTSDRTPAAIRAVPLWQLPSPVRGDGMRIGIVDDGIDIRRPSFSGAGYTYPAGFPKGLPEGVNGKIIVARAFAPPGAPARERTAFDPDGSAHGTHVAGIAAGNFGITATLESGIPVPGLSGVAPRAYLGSYRALTTPTPAFGLDGQGAALARAIDAAVADGMDVINLSVGEPPVGRRDVVERAIAGAARAGVVVTVAAGNDGDAGGHGTISSPGSAADAITVAAVTSDRIFAREARVLGPAPVPAALQLFAAVRAPGAAMPDSWQSGLPLVAGTGCGGGAVAGSLLLVRLSAGCDADAAALEARSGGAAGAVLVSPTAGVPEEVPIDTLPCVLVTRAVGDALAQGLQAAAGPLTLSVGRSQRPVVSEGGVPASFSSRGPTWLGGLKPDIAAPGEGILSPVPGGYAIWSGTSMASPAVAGAAALLLQRHPGWTPPDVKAALALSARPVAAPPLTVGAGFVDVAAADAVPLLADSAAVRFGVLRPGATVRRSVTLRDAGTGAGAWSVEAAGLGAPAQITIPTGGAAQLELTLSPAAKAKRGDRQGYVSLVRGAERLRLRWWGHVERPGLASVTPLPLHPGWNAGDTRRGQRRASAYRWPDDPSGLGLTRRYTGREQLFTFTVPRGALNAGVRVAGGRGVPQILWRHSENALAGITALPLTLNPYQERYLEPQPVSALLLPAQRRYWVSVETPSGSRPGRYRLRLWIDDSTPPAIDRIAVVQGPEPELRFRVRDAGSGVSPDDLLVEVDGEGIALTYNPRTGLARASLDGVGTGRHPVRITAADYQETKNSENAAAVGLPNTRVVKTTIRVG